MSQLDFIFLFNFHRSVHMKAVCVEISSETREEYWCIFFLKERLDLLSVLSYCSFGEIVKIVIFFFFMDLYVLLFHTKANMPVTFSEDCPHLKFGELLVNC